MSKVLDPTEHVIMRMRRHPFALISESSTIAAAAFAPLLLYPFLSRPEWFGLSGNPVFLFIAIVSAWGLLFWMVFYKILLDYYLDVWILTDKKLIDVEQKGIFRREVATLMLESIQDVTVEVSGIIPTMLNFGEVRVQTAGANREFQMHQMRNPYQIKEAVVKAHGEALARSRIVQMQPPQEYISLVPAENDSALPDTETIQ